jgi:hypothetical protein
VENRTRGFRAAWPQCVNDLMPRIASVFLKAKEIGIWTPGLDIYQRQRGAGLLVAYLRSVGTFLGDGHFKEAKSTALEAKREIEKP